MTTPLSILVAEDDFGDVLLLRRAFDRAGVDRPVYFARDGQEILDYLEGKPPFENPVQYPLPNVLLLDLNLPRLSGFEVLSWVRNHPTLHSLFVVVLSASDWPEQIKRAYLLGANAYEIKPSDPAELIGMIKRLQDHWLQINSQAEPVETAAAALSF